MPFARPPLIACGVALLALAGCAAPEVLDPAGPVAAANKAIVLNSLAVMLAIVVPTIGAAFAYAWWFRAGNKRAKYDPEFVFSGRVEAVVWGIPVMTIIFLGGLIWIGSHQQDPRRPLPSAQRPLTVQVVSLDWKWLFLYPEQGVASVNRLVLPVGRPVRFQITSASVMNAFFVPRLGSQIYAMNGMATELNLQADRPGRYRGLSSHYSGDGFAKMGFAVDALPAAGFDGWVRQAQAAPVAMDQATYRQLSRQGEAAPALFSRADPHLFHAIVHQQLPPAPGPQTGRGGHPEVSHQ